MAHHVHDVTLEPENYTTPRDVTLQGELDYRNPMEVEKAYYSDQESPLPAIAGQETG